MSLTTAPCGQRVKWRRSNLKVRQGFLTVAAHVLIKQ